MTYITALVLVCVMQNFLPASAQGMIAMPKACSGEYILEERYKYGHNAGPLTMELCDPVCHISPSTEDALMGSGQVFTADEDTKFRWNVTNNWEGIYADFPVRALCTIVRNVDRVTVLYSSSLQTDAIFQKVDIDDPTVWTKVCSSLPTIHVERVSLRIKQADSGDLKIKNTVLKYCVRPLITSS